MPLFFLPFELVAEWAGAPKGLAASNRWLAATLGLAFPSMDDKTLRNALKSPEGASKRTRSKLASLDNAITSKLGIAWPPTVVPEEAVGTTLRWPEWEAFTGRGDGNPAINVLPETRKTIQRLAIAERDVARCIAAAPDLQSAVVSLVDNPLARLLCSDNTAATILQHLPKLKSVSDLKEFASDPVFKRWQVHCVVSLLMNILAKADLEYCKDYIPLKGASSEPLERSMVLRILPRVSAETAILPLPALLQCWYESGKSKGKGFSYRQMAKMIPGPTNTENKAKMLRLWRQGKHIPDKHGIEGIIKGLIPEHESDRQVARVRYHIAQLLHRLYRSVEQAWPGSTVRERVRLFQTFVQHRSN